MHLMRSALALASAAIPLFAQNCNQAPSSQTIPTENPYAVSFYGGQSAPAPAGYTGMAEYTDMVLSGTVTITAIRKSTYDQGVGNPVNPNQVGNQAIVNIYTCPTTWTGNQFTRPGTPTSTWTLQTTGTLTVVAWNALSPIVLTQPITLGAGSYGLCIETTPPTTGANAGPLHCLYNSTAVTNSDQFVAFRNCGIQNNSFTTGTFSGTINMEMDYLPAANSGYFTQFGSGCYFRPRGFYEDFPDTAVSTPDLANTNITLFPNIAPSGNPDYLVLPAGPGIQQHGSTNLVNTAPGSSSSGALTAGQWDDSMTAPITLPFLFNFPGGSTTAITIGSNGFVYLASVVDNSFAACGASYGSIGSFLNEPARMAPFYADFDMSPARAPSAGLFYDVDPASHWVRITWENAIDFSSPAALNTLQLTLYDSGQAEICYGQLHLDGLDSDAVVGFTPGTGATLAPQLDLDTAMPFESGDGSIPPIIGMDARPMLGTTPNILVTNLTPGTGAVVLALGFVAIPTGLDLASVGAPGCSAYLNLLASNFALVNNSQAAFPVGIPASNVFQGVTVFAQGAPLTAGLNALGILTSNGLCIRLGQ